jgi:hypothetical protein
MLRARVEGCLLSFSLYTVLAVSVLVRSDFVRLFYNLYHVVKSSVPDCWTPKGLFLISMLFAPISGDQALSRCTGYTTPDSVPSPCRCSRANCGDTTARHRSTPSCCGHPSSCHLCCTCRCCCVRPRSSHLCRPRYQVLRRPHLVELRRQLHEHRKR